MTYHAPVSDILFSLMNGAGLARAVKQGFYGDFDIDVTPAVLEEAGRFANDVLAPLNRVGDTVRSQLHDGKVTTPPGWPEAYRRWVEGGWNSVSGPEAWGGQGLPMAVNAACNEIWAGANMAFGLCPLLTACAVHAMNDHASEELQKGFLPKLTSGEWTGTMLLTEPQAGSDVGLLKTKAERMDDGSYRLFGTKIFITYGEHDMTDNIIHFVLARVPDSPAGTRGISLFLVPKFLVNADGSLGARNDIYATGIEHKLGIHASPTCTITMGDNGGAVGYLVGEENRGMSYMFTMMNEARLGVGLEGVGIAEGATQHALAYARERKQGRAGTGNTIDPIIMHPDVSRMLLTMRALTGSARNICFATSVALDIAARAPDADVRKAAASRAALLTPLAKAFSTDIGIEVSSLGIQVHGGMGFIEETGAAQYMRDARIAAIYEGTNGIQAVDLVTRKLGGDGGEAMRVLIGELRESVTRVSASNNPAFGACAERLRESIDSLERASEWLLGKLGSAPTDALAGATPYLRLASIAVGGCLLAEDALASAAIGDSEQKRIGLARFFAENVSVQSQSLEETIVSGSHIACAAELLLAS